MLFAKAMQHAGTSLTLVIADCSSLLRFVSYLSWLLQFVLFFVPVAVTDLEEKSSLRRLSMTAWDDLRDAGWTEAPHGCVLRLHQQHARVSLGHSHLRGCWPCPLPCSHKCSFVLACSWSPVGSSSLPGVVGLAPTAASKDQTRKRTSLPNWSWLLYWPIRCYCGALARKRVGPQVSTMTTDFSVCWVAVELLHIFCLSDIFHNSAKE